MKYPSTFVLNLSRQKISLAITSPKKPQQVLDSFDPNEPAGSQSLKRLFLLAKALNKNTPEVEVFLPNDMIHYETFISESSYTPQEIRKIIAERKQVPTCDIQLAIGENVGSRAISIAFVETSVIEELCQFIKQAGFKIKCFRAGNGITGFNSNHKLFPEYISPKNKKITSYLTPKPALAAVFLVLAFFLTMTLGINFYNDVYNRKSPPPYMDTELQFTDSINSIEKFTSPNSILGNFNFPKALPPKRISISNHKTFEGLYRFNVIDSQHPPELGKHSGPTLISKSGTWFKGYNLTPAHTNIAEFNTPEMITEDTGKNLTFHEGEFEVTELLHPVYDSELIIPDQISSNKKIQNFPRVTRPEPELSQNQTNQVEITPILTAEEGEDSQTAIEDSKNVGEEPQELSIMAMEYALKFMPYKKPLLIDSIRILSEPTISTGALVFLKAPLVRPDIIIKSKKISPSEVNIQAKATRSPSIPEHASVGHNSTKRNFIDLDRTNLIGIVGKRSNPRALVRLANGTVLTLKVGAVFEGWRVFAIDRDKIHVENGSRQEILRLPG